MATYKRPKEQSQISDEERWERYLAKCPCPNSNRHGWLKNTAAKLKIAFKEMDASTMAMLLRSRLTRKEKNNGNEVALIVKWIYGGTATIKSAQTTEPEKPTMTFPVTATNAVDYSNDDLEQMYTLLKHCFKQNEYVWISGGDKDANGAFSGKRWKVDDALYEIREGDPLHSFQQKQDGLFIKVNPISPDFKSTTPSSNNVADFRDCIFEGDDKPDAPFPLAEQLKVIADTNVPVRSITYSGGKSYHFRIAIDAGNDAKLYEERKTITQNILNTEAAKYGRKFDSVQDPVRWTRLAGAYRENTQQQQKLIALNEAKWVDPQEHNPLAEIMIENMRSANDSITTPLPRPPEIMQGIFRAGDIVSLTASSKVGKTWELLRLAHAIVTGGRWLEIQCNISAVLYLNFELHDYDMDARINHIFQGDQHGSHSLTVLNLRGRSGDADAIMQALHHIIDQGAVVPDAIIVDPIYRFYGDADENSNSEMGVLLLNIVRFAKSVNSAVIYAHHHAKGKSRQDEFKAGEQQSGAGVFTRNYDANLNLSAVKDQDGVSRLDFDLRNFKSKPPMFVEWDEHLCQMVVVQNSEIEARKEATKEEQRTKKAEAQTRFINGYKGIWGNMQNADKTKVIAKLKEASSTIETFDRYAITTCDGWADKVFNRIMKAPHNFGLIRTLQSRKTGGKESVFSAA